MSEPESPPEPQRAGLYKLDIDSDVTSTGLIRGGTVGTTAAQLPASPCKKGVLVHAAAGNANTVYVGLSNAVTANAGQATSGFPLAADKSVFLPLDDASRVWLIGGAADQNYTVAAF